MNSAVAIHKLLTLFNPFVYFNSHTHQVGVGISSIKTNYMFHVVTYIGHYISTLYITYIRHYISALFNLSFMFIHCHKR